MRSYEIEALEAGKAHGAGRDDADADSATPELAARAAAAGRIEALGPAAVLRLQRAAGNAGVAAVLEEEPESPVKDVVGKGSGQPLESTVRQRMETSFGADFSDVRVHSGGTAAASARAVDAHAYTVGNEIVLGDGQTPGSATHERTLAHELTHVVQQRSGPVEGTPTAGGISVSDPADRFERAAEATADAVLGSGRAPDAAAGDSIGASVQRRRQGEEEEQEVAGTAQSAAAQAGALEGPLAGEAPIRESTQTPTATAETAEVAPPNRTPATAETAQAGAGAAVAETAQAGAGAAVAETAQAGGTPALAETAQAGGTPALAETAQAGAAEAAGYAEEEEVQELAIQREPEPDAERLLG